MGLQVCWFTATASWQPGPPSDPQLCQRRGGREGPLKRDIPYIHDCVHEFPQKRSIYMPIHSTLTCSLLRHYSSTQGYFYNIHLYLSLPRYLLSLTSDVVLLLVCPNQRNTLWSTLLSNSISTAADIRTSLLYSFIDNLSLDSNKFTAYLTCTLIHRFYEDLHSNSQLSYSPSVIFLPKLLLKQYWYIQNKTILTFKTILVFISQSTYNFQWRGHSYFKTLKQKIHKPTPEN